eukprot:1146510-Pelagomonas_calceolata.AAC.4
MRLQVSFASNEVAPLFGRGTAETLFAELVGLGNAYVLPNIIVTKASGTSNLGHAFMVEDCHFTHI